MSKNLIDKIKSVGRKSLIATMIAASTFYSCSKDDLFENYIEEEAEIVNKTIILKDNELNNIVSFTDKEIYFNNVKDYNIGDIIAGGISEKSPYGILEKIIGVSNDKKSFEIGDAALSEVIIEGKFNFSKELKMNDLDSRKSSKISKSQLNGYEFDYEIDNMIIYDKDGNLETVDDQIVARGNISFNADFEMDVEFKEGVKYLSFESNIESKTELEIITGGENINNSINSKKVLYEISFSPFLIPGPVGIPIIINPNIEISVGVIGELNGELKQKVSLETNFNNNLVYENGEWNNSPTSNIEFIYSNPESIVNTEMKGYVEPKLSLLLYNSAGPFLSIENYLKLNIDIENSPWWTLDAGIDAFVGIDMRRLEKYIPSYEKLIWNYEERLGEADGEIEEVVWSDNFESYSIGSFPNSWDPDANANNYSTNKVIDENGNKILQLYGAVGGCWGALTYHNLGVDSSYEISLDIKNGSENNNGCHNGRGQMGLRKGNHWSNESETFFHFDKQGKLYSRKNEVIANLNLNEWNNIKVKYMSEENKRLIYYLNGEEIHEETAVLRNDVNNLELVVQEGTAYFDNIKVKKINN